MEDDVLVAEVTIRYVIKPDGEDIVYVEATDQSGDVPPLINMLGMLDMARDPIYALARGEYEEDEDDDVEDDEDAAS